MRELLNFRYYVILALATIGMSLLIVELPEDLSVLSDLVISLVLLIGSMASIAAAVRLYRYWLKQGKIKSDTEIFKKLYFNDKSI